MKTTPNSFDAGKRGRGLEARASGCFGPARNDCVVKDGGCAGRSAACGPSSELHIAEDWYRRTALSDLLQLGDEEVN